MKIPNSNVQSIRPSDPHSTLWINTEITIIASDFHLDCRRLEVGSGT